MSRRREAADLARALALSTQEARVVSKLPPYKLSSSVPSSTTTQDSKEMELRPYVPGAVPSPAPVGQAMGYDHAPTDHYTPTSRLMPGVGTVRPEDIMRPPTVLGSGATENGTGTESVDVSPASGSGGSGGQRSSAYHTDIQSFPPSIPPGIIVPSTNSPAHPHPHSGSSSSAHPPSSSSGNGGNPFIPSSFSHRRPPPTSSSTFPSPAYSSPLPPAAAGPSHVSSTELSSNRPLFSSTEGSGNPVSHHDSWSRVPPVVRTYGRSNRTPSPVKDGREAAQAERIVLSSSPMSAAAVTPRRRSASPAKKRRVVQSSDDEEEEQIELRPSRNTAVTPRSRLEVVLPNSRPQSASKQRGSVNNDVVHGHTDGANRHQSPDLLDVLDEKNRTPAKGKLSSSVHPPSSVMTNSTRAGSVIPSTGMSEGSRRASSRVADSKLKAEQETEERRRKRREEKERKKVEDANMASNLGMVKQPPKSVPAKNKQPAAVVSVEEPIDLEESIIEVAAPSPPPPPPLQPVIRASPPHAAENNRKKRKSDAIETPDDVVEDGDFDPAEGSKGKAKGKGKGKKGKKVTPKRGKKVEKVIEPEPELVIEADIAAPDEGVEAGQVVHESPAVTAMVPEPDSQVAEEAKGHEVEMEEEEELPKSPTPPPARSRSPIRPPLRPTLSNNGTPSTASVSHRPSPGPVGLNGSPSLPGGIKWKAPRNDLTSVLSKFGGAKRSGMSKRLRIMPLHAKIGPPVKALPPAPKKPEKKKKGDDEDEDEEEEEFDEDGNVVKKVKDGKKGMEWFMVED